MNAFDQELADRLARIQADGLLRHVRRVDTPQQARIQIDGERLLNFSSNDYLGLANHPALWRAAIHATERFGAGCGASRLICGSLAPHHELEEALAKFKESEAALVFSTGYATALGTIGALLSPDDVVVLDRKVHASLVDAARLCGAKIRVFRHNDPTHLENILEWADQRRAQAAQSGGHGNNGGKRRPRTLIVTESVFSMDGDLAPLRDLVELKDRFGAWLMVDEAHATGLFGPDGRGLVAECGLGDRVEIQMGTLGKALGASGGYVAGSRRLVDYLVNRARTFIFSTAPVPAAAGAARAAVELAAGTEGSERRARVWALVDHLKNGLIKAGWPLSPVQSAIVPIILGEPERAVEGASFLRRKSLFVPAIRYPTVGRREARLRVTVTAGHQISEVDELTAVMAEFKSTLADSK